MDTGISLRRAQRVRVNEDLSEIRVALGMPQGSVLGPILFLVYVNDIGRDTNPDIRLFTYDYIIYRKILDSSDTGKLQTDLNKLGERAVVNEMKINPDKSTAVSFTRASVKDRLTYYFGDQLIPEVNTFKYLGIIIRSDLRWADHVNYTLRKAWKALHLIMLILKQGNNNTNRLAYTFLVRPIFEYGSVFWDLCREW
jgi:hypothetical protein